jgi:hypothetical protein
LKRSTPLKQGTPLQHRTPISRVGKLAAKSVDLMAKAEKPLRMRKCAVKGCAARFQPRSMAHKACSPACAEIVAVAERKRLEAKQIKDRKAALKTKSDHLKEAQATFNTWIRERDKDQPCISCGRMHQGAWDAGHYRSVGAQPALRFHEQNVHRQCVPCNQHKGGNAIEYRLGLIRRLGREVVEFLEREHPTPKWTIDDIKQIKATYAAKIKAMKGSQS